MTQPLNSAPVIIVREVRSVGVALLLTFLFGPLGMLYSTISGALIMIAVSVVLAVFTLGFSLFLTWPISIVWGAMAASAHNQRVLSGVR
ncbi:MAG TPA: hypothetical protein VLK84_08060 [Longimicrobium sp.]|nr:hypothetical protein [Longimicrobium sp.]